MILQEKLDFLLDKYGIRKKAILSNHSVTVDGKKIALLPWRNERRFAELKNSVNDGTLSDVSVIRVCRIDKKGTDLNSMIYRGLDLCEWLIGSEAAEIMTFKNNGAANIVVKLKNGVVCTMEASAVLPAGAVPVDKHEIISRRGIACDRVVDTQVPQQSIYVYADAENPKTYTDVDFELFGLGAGDVALVRQAFDAARNGDLSKELDACAKRLERLVALSDKSASEGCNLKVEGSI